MLNLLRLAALALSSLFIHSASPEALPEQTSVTFISHTPLSEVAFCRGVLAGSWIITVEHCLRDSRKRIVKGENLSITVPGKGRRFIKPEVLGTAGATPFAALMQSRGLDFVVLPLPGGAVDRMPFAPVEIVGSVDVNEDVNVPSERGRFQKCKVNRVCGGEFSYLCKHDTVPGWSGGGVWKKVAGEWKLVGLHKRGEGLNSGSATSFPTILGRSSRLFANPDDLANTFARNRTFAYKWKPAGACTHSLPTQPVEARLIEDSSLIHGIAAIDQNYLITFNSTNSRTCVYDVRAFRRRFCSTNPSRSSNGINSIATVSSNLIAFTESSKPPFHVGSVSFASIDVKRGKIAFDPLNYPRSSGMIGSIFNVAVVGKELFAAGANGICKVDGSQCIPVCSNDTAKCSNQWRANGIVAINNEEFVVVGRDYRSDLGNGKAAVAGCNWYRRVVGVWELAGQCTVGSTRPIVEVMRKAGREFQLKAPVLVDGDVVAFGSDGGAYLLGRGKAPTPIPITALEHNEAQIEDSVRSAVKVGPNQIFVGSSDGTLRLIVFGRDATGHLVAHAEPSYTVYDRGIWTTETASGNGWTAAQGQDGNVTVVYWKSALPK